MKTKFVNRPSTLGIVPLMLFAAREMLVRDERLPKEAGMKPVKLFNRKSRRLSFFKELSSTGIIPSRWLPLKDTTLQLKQRLKLTGSGPPNVFFDRLRSRSRYK
ncbi:hypothetical protein LguiA_007763 [Lonicera macranthoides]